MVLPSFRPLKNLRILNLSAALNLTDLPEGFAELRNLEEVHLPRTAIKELPEEMSELTKLSLLRLPCACRNWQPPPSMEEQGLRVEPCDCGACTSEMNHAPSVSDVGQCCKYGER